MAIIKETNTTWARIYVNGDKTLCCDIEATKNGLKIGRDLFLWEEIDAARPGFVWINVSDRLPQENGETLCFSPGLGIFIADFGLYPDGGGSWFDDGEVWFPGQDITHWLPLPAPPVSKEVI
jgi:hypothetical protein